MNLANDVARCVGKLNWNNDPGPEDFCPHRKTCERHIQMDRDRNNGLEHYRGMSVISNCLVDGEYTLLIPTKETQC